MDLVNPFEEVVVFGKAYPVAWPPQGASSVKAAVPTGRHVSHENALKHAHNSSGGGGRATRLEHYHNGSGGGGKATKLEHYGHRKTGPAKGLERTHHKARGFRPGPFKKAFEQADVEKGLFSFGARAAKKKQVARGLAMAVGDSSRPASRTSTARGLQMAAGQKGVMPRTGRTGENVIAPSRPNPKYYAPGDPKGRGPIGSTAVITQRGQMRNSEQWTRRTS